jgi:hypothetical protein
MNRSSLELLSPKFISTGLLKERVRYNVAGRAALKGLKFNFSAIHLTDQKTAA